MESDFKPDVMTILTDIWNAFMKGKGMAGRKVEMKVGHKIYDEFLKNVEVIQRESQFRSSDTRPVFKTGRMMVDPHARNPYSIKIGWEN